MATVGYNIQHHGSDLIHLSWLVGMLVDHAAFLHVSLDATADSISALSSELRSLYGDKVEVTKSLPVTWAGPSVLSQMREMLHRAVAVDGWEYLINLSGSCIPTIPPRDIQEALVNRYTSSGSRSYVYRFFPELSPYWVRYYASDHVEVKNYGRIQLRCDHAVAQAFQEDGFDPLRKVMHRRGVHCQEHESGTCLALRGLYSAEFRDRQAFWSHRRYAVGRQWFVLHRSHAEWLCSSQVAAEIYNVCSQMFVPDECYLQVALGDPANPYIEEVDFRENFRYLQGSPSRLTVESLQAAIDGPSLFARKVGGDGAELRGRVQLLIQGGDRCVR